LIVDGQDFLAIMLAYPPFRENLGGTCLLSNWQQRKAIEMCPNS
jgi:hypothetical protein